VARIVKAYESFEEQQRRQEAERQKPQPITPESSS